MLHSYIINKVIEPFNIDLQKAQILIDKHKELKAVYQYWIYLRELEFYALVINKKPSNAIIEKIQTDFISKENIFNLSQKNGLLFAMAKCYFLVQEYENCQDLLLKITLEHNVLIKDFYFLEIYLSEILCYYELDHNQIAKQKWKSLHRKISKSNIEPAELIVAIDKIGQLIKSKEERIEVFEEINDLMKAKSNNTIFTEDFYFLSVWVGHKIDLLKA